MRNYLWLLVFLSCSAFSAPEGHGRELEQLHSALSMLNQEEQALYQQFQMVQELLRTNGQPFYGVPMQGAGDVPNYADVLEAQKSMIHRRDSLNQEADRLLRRYGEIEEKKKPLIEQIYLLTISR